MIDGGSIRSGSRKKADGWAETASEAVELVKELVKRRE